MKIAVFGAGCFWGVEARFRALEGVLDTAVGYMGGEVESPTYEQVCTHTTGHTEVVQVVYDPEVISYRDLLAEFFVLHDPTQVNRQGPDVGEQYRSVIFAADDEQSRQAQEMIADLQSSPKFDSRPIATTVERMKTFWRAEEYHQQYMEKNNLPQCHF